MMPFFTQIRASMISVLALSVAAQYTLEANYDYGGNDILSPTGTDAAACQKLCNDDSKCVGYIIIENDPNVPCWTKRVLVGRVFKPGWMTYHKTSTTDGNDPENTISNATEMTLPSMTFQPFQNNATSAARNPLTKKKSSESAESGDTRKSMTIPLIIISIFSSCVVLVACILLLKSRKRPKKEYTDKSNSYSDYSDRNVNKYSIPHIYQTGHNLRNSRSTIYNPKTYDTPQFGWLPNSHSETLSSNLKNSESTATRSSQNETCFSNSEYQLSYQNSKVYF